MKSIIFDFDGTLVDSLELVFKCVNRLASKYRFEPIAISAETRSKSISDIIKQDLKLKGVRLLAFVRDVKRLLRQEMTKVRFHPGMIDAWQKLSQTKQLFILTTNSQEIVRHLFTKYGLSLPQHIQADSAVFGKDQVLEKLITKYHLRKEQTVYVGDEVRDAEACRKINLRIIAVAWGYDNKTALAKSKPDFLVDTPKQMMEIVNRSP